MQQICRARLVDPIRDHHRIHEASSAGAVLLALANCLAKGLHPFPKTLSIVDAVRRAHLEPVSSPAALTNPLPAAWARLEKPFLEATQGVSLGSDSEEDPPSAEAVETVLEAARDAATQSAPSQVYLDALRAQNPEFEGVLAWLGVKPRDLLRLQLVLQPAVAQRVDSLHGVGAA